MAEEITIEYDKDTDTMYLFEKGFRGEIIAKEHPDEEMVSLLYSVDDGRRVGMAIDNWSIFVVKYFPRALWVRFIEIFRRFIPLPSRHVKECYTHFAAA
jgi:hypothetical protein